MYLVISTISSLSNLFKVANTFDIDISEFGFLLFFSVALTCFSLFVYIKYTEMIIRKKTNFLPFYVITSIVRFVILVIYTSIFSEVVAGGDLIVNFILVVVSLAIILNYFSKSTRVRIYFGNDE